MIIAQCCGIDVDYCECPRWVTERANALALAREDCPPAPPLDYDPGEPPF